MHMVMLEQRLQTHSRLGANLRQEPTAQPPSMLYESLECFQPINPVMIARDRKRRRAVVSSQGLSCGACPVRESKPSAAITLCDAPWIHAHPSSHQSTPCRGTAV